MNDSRHIIRTLFSKVLSSIILMVSGIVVARVLGPSGKGEYTIVLLVAGMAASLGSLNIGEAAIYFYNRKHVELGKIIFTAALFILAASIFCVAVILIMQSYGILPWKELSQPLLLLFACLLIPIIFSQHYMLELLRSIKKFGIYNAMFLLQPLVYLVLILILILQMKMGVKGALIANAAALMISIIVGFFFIIRNLNSPLKPDYQYLKDSIAYGAKGHIGNIFQKFNTRLDQFFISPYWGSAMLGSYSVAVSLCELIWYIPDSIGVVILSRIAGSNNKDASDLTEKSSRITIALIIILIIILYILARPAVLIIYGHPFEPAIQAIYFLLPGIFFMSLSKVISKYFSGVGRPEINTLTSFISSTATVILCVILIPRYGITGAAVASSIAYALRATCDMAFFMRISQSRLIELLILRKEDLRQLGQVFRIV